METYRGFVIRRTDPVPPIPGWEQFKFEYIRKEYDIGDDLGHGPTVASCKAAIDQIIEDAS